MFKDRHNLTKYLNIQKCKVVKLISEHHQYLFKIGSFTIGLFFILFFLDFCMISHCYNYNYNEQVNHPPGPASSVVERSLRKFFVRGDCGLIPAKELLFRPRNALMFDGISDIWTGSSNQRNLDSKSCCDASTG